MTTTDTIPDLDERLCFGAYRLNRAFNRFYQRVFSDTGLTYPKFVILSALHEHGAMSLSQLSNRAGVEPNTLSPLVKKMATFGTLSRERPADDERRIVIDLTDQGRAALAEVRKVVGEGFAELGLDPKAVEAMLASFEDVRSRLDEADPPKLSLD